MTDSKPVAIVCATCGSDDVRRDAYAAWDAEAQRWVLAGLFDQGNCETCGEERLVETPLCRAAAKAVTHVIWSEEHGAWWAPNESGYTRLLAQAGRYPKSRADEIVAHANFLPGIFHEVALPDPMAEGDAT